MVGRFTADRERVSACCASPTNRPMQPMSGTRLEPATAAQALWVLTLNAKWIQQWENYAMAPDEVHEVIADIVNERNYVTEICSTNC